MNPKKEEKKGITKEERIFEIYKFYKKVFDTPKELPKETLEEKIERINPYYTRNETIQYAGE